MKQSTTLLATLATAQAIKLSSKAKFIPGLDLPDIPIISDIPDVLGDGIDIMGQGLNEIGDIVVDGYDITMGGLEDIGKISYDGLTDLGDITYDGLAPIGQGLYDLPELTVEGFDAGIDFVGTQGSGFVNVMEDDVGGFIVDDIGGGFTDAYDWASNDGNWEAFGKTFLAGGKLFFEGDFDGAGQVWGNDEHYTEKFWDDLDDARREYEEAMRQQKENEKKHQKNIADCRDRLVQHQVREVEQQEEQDQLIRDKYDEYLVNYEADVQEARDNYKQDYSDAKADYDAQRDPIIEHYDNAKASRADYCASADQPIGSTQEVPIKNSDLTAQMTKTQYFSYQLGSGAANWVWTNLFNSTKVTRETCEQEDCLHRCYGTAMTSNCAVCYDNIVYYAAHLNHPDVQQSLKQTCNKCAVPPAKDPTYPEEFPAYEAPTFPEPMTLVEYEDALYQAIEEQESEPVVTELTPEEIKKREDYETVENFCKEHVPEYAEYFASRESN